MRDLVLLFILFSILLSGKMGVGQEYELEIFYTNTFEGASINSLDDLDSAWNKIIEEKVFPAAFEKGAIQIYFKKTYKWEAGKIIPSVTVDFLKQVKKSSEKSEAEVSKIPEAPSAPANLRIETE